MYRLWASRPYNDSTERADLIAVASRQELLAPRAEGSP